MRSTRTEALSRLLSALTTVTLVLAAPRSLPGQQQQQRPPATPQQQPATSGFPATAFAGLQYRNIGPNRGGRSIASAGSAKRPKEYFFGAVGGGLWKTVDGGMTWRPVTDGQLKSSSVSAVAVSESNPDIVFIGMGETELRGNIMQGDGIYKSTDGGKTWTPSGLETTQAIARVRVHPTNPDIVFAAVFGHPSGKNAERGVYRSRDGAKTWSRMLYRGDSVGAVDLSIDPKNPNVIFAAMWEAYRKPWRMSSGGMAGGLFKSVDGGDTWIEITRNPGLPKGLIGKIGVAVSPVDGNRVYAIVENDSGGVFRSDDAGATWTRLNDERKLRQRAFYYSRIYADPLLKDRVYVLNTGLYRSDDGGKTFPTQLRGTHGDFHDLWIASDNSARMITSNDGGGAVTETSGQVWTAQRFPTAQAYHVATTKDFQYHVCGAQQDNSTFCIPSNPNVRDVFNAGQGSFGDWLYDVGGGESGYIAPHPANPNVFYAGSQGALLTRYDRSTGIMREVQVYPRFFSGESAASLPERWQWTYPIVFSPVDPNVLYTSSQHVWKSTNEGMSWERISPDLTAHVDSTLGDTGGPITHDQNGPEIFATVFTIAPSKTDANTIWTGSDDGLAYITRDGGKNWTNVTPPGIGRLSRISIIDASPHDPAKAYMAVKRYLQDDRAPYIWKTTDYGQTWKKIVKGIRTDDYVHVVREDPKRKGLLFAGAEHGVYVSFDDGENWQSLSLNLPDVQVPDLQIEENDLVIATHGRSMWILDDIGPIRQLTSEAVKAPLTVFAPRDVIRRVNDANFYFHLAKAADSVVVEVADAAGKPVRRFVGLPSDTLKKERPLTDEEMYFGLLTLPPPGFRAGLNKFRWDLRYGGATVFDGMILWSAIPQWGPLAPPGEYTVRVTANGESRSQKLRIMKDPRLKEFTDADLVEQFTLAMKIRDRLSAANEGVIQTRDVKRQIGERTRQAGDKALTADGDQLSKSFSGVEEELYQVRNRSGQDPLNFPIKLNNRLATLQLFLESGDMRPTAGSRKVFEELSAALDVQLKRLDTLIQTDLERFNAKLRMRKLEPVKAGTRGTVM